MSRSLDIEAVITRKECWKTQHNNINLLSWDKWQHIMHWFVIFRSLEMISCCPFSGNDEIIKLFVFQITNIFTVDWKQKQRRCCSRMLDVCCDNELSLLLLIAGQAWMLSIGFQWPVSFHLTLKLQNSLYTTGIYMILYLSQSSAMFCISHSFCSWNFLIKLLGRPAKWLSLLRNKLSTSW